MKNKLFEIFAFIGTLEFLILVLINPQPTVKDCTLLLFFTIMYSNYNITNNRK